MNLLFPFLAAVIQAGSYTLDKVTLSIKRIGFKEYTGASFPLIFLFTLIFFFVFRPPLDSVLFSNGSLLLLAASIVILIGNNLFFYRALDKDDLSELQIFDLFVSIPIILFASFVFSDERNLVTIVLALTASLAIVWSHWENHHFKIARLTAPYFIWIIAAGPINAAIAKKLLIDWNPIALEMFKNGGLALVFGLFFIKQVSRIPKRGWLFLVATNLLSAVAYILYYYSYKLSGIVYTSLIFALQPLLVYFASLFFLKEPFHRKKGVAFIVVLISIVIAQFLE